MKTELTWPCLLLQELKGFIDHWAPYKFLWRGAQNRKDMLKLGLTDLEGMLRRHGELEADLATEPDMYYFGCLAISTGKVSGSSGLYIYIYFYTANVFLLSRHFQSGSSSAC